MPAPLSVSIVCCNNEDVIRRCVQSVLPVAAEIVAVDSGSTDATKDILAESGAVRIIDQPWLGYVKQKQFALEQCAQPWILHLDSDESVEPELRDAIVNLIDRDPQDVAGGEVNRLIHYRGRALQHAWRPEWRLRLVRNGRAKWGGYDPHDKLELINASDRAVKLNGDLRHDAIPDIASFLARQVSHARVGAASYAQMGRRSRPRDLVTSPMGAFLRQMVLRQAWRDGPRGWIAAAATASATLMKHMINLESQLPSDPPTPPSPPESAPKDDA